MRFQQTAALRDGERIIIRSLEKEDAAAAIWLMRKTAGETDFLMRETDECCMTIAQEQEYIERMNESPREALIGTFIDGELVGMGNLSQVAPRFRVRHRATVGIAMVKTHWGKGAGKAMMHVLIELAKNMGYEQIELSVVDKNDRAVSLYKCLGFQTVGKIPRAFKYKDDSVADIINMVLYL